MQKLLQSSLAGLLSLSMGAGIAAEVKPEDAIEYRQSVYTLIKWNFAPIGAMVKGQVPYDAAAVARHTAFLETLSKMPLEGFTPGSNTGDTKAKPEIWKNRQEFEKLMSDFQEQITKLNQVAHSGDQAAVKEQFGAAAKSCKNCHDKFRKE
ncbi:MAG TPA: cytochrome c [Candidatus Competibacteraceae bacterium]|nr:cytochrome c [Candidatus Competibacteraceae bacterium]